MNVIIDNAITDAQLAEVSKLRHQVFAQEWGLSPEPVEPVEDGRAWHLIAWHGTTGKAVGVLTVLDTTGHTRLHEQIGLQPPADARVARYTQLAVLKEFRGMGIPLRLMLKARERVIRPGRFNLTWLLYRADRIESCSFRVALGFQAQPGIVAAAHGPCQLLISPEPAYILQRMAA